MNEAAAGSTPRLRSALLIDAENMYSGLTAINPAAAKEFVTSPLRWMTWLTKLTYPQVAGIARRDLLVRACYLNPDTGGALWRPAFVQAGFQAIDCPSLTSAGKNSADIHMVIAMLDLLNHPTHFDEIIVMSSDADFTPALTRIRAHDRRTVVVASGPHAPVLPSSCDLLVPAVTFIHEALTNPTTAGSQLTPLAAPAVPPAPVKKIPTKKATTAKKATTKSAANQTEAAGPGTAKKATPKKQTTKANLPVSPALPTDARARASQAVADIIHASPAPVALASIAKPVRDILGPDLAGNYDGANSLKKLLQELDLPGFQVSNGTPGYLFDPTRHTPPTGA